MHKGAHVFMATLVLFTVSTTALGYALAKEARRDTSRERQKRTTTTKIPWYCVKTEVGGVVAQPSVVGQPAVQKRSVTNILKAPSRGTLTKQVPTESLKKPTERVTKKNRYEFVASKPPAREPPAERGDGARPGYSDDKRTPTPGYVSPGYYGTGGSVAPDGGRGPKSVDIPPIGDKNPDDPTQGDGWVMTWQEAYDIANSTCPPGYAISIQTTVDVCMAYLETLKTNPAEAKNTDPEIVKMCKKILNPKVFSTKLNKSLCQQFMNASDCVQSGKEECPSVVKIFSDAGISNKEMIKTLNDAGKYCAGIAASTP